MNNNIINDKKNWSSSKRLGKIWLAVGLKNFHAENAGVYQNRKSFHAEKDFADRWLKKWESMVRVRKDFVSRWLKKLPGSFI